MKIRCWSRDTSQADDASNCFDEGVVLEVEIGDQRRSISEIVTDCTVDQGRADRRYYEMDAVAAELAKRGARVVGGRVRRGAE